MDKPTVWTIRTWYTEAWGEDDGERTVYELKPLKKMREALAEGADPNERNALYTAVDKGSASQVKVLIKAGADVNAVDEDGLTPLHKAVERGGEVFDVLLSAGADINARTSRVVDDQPITCQLAYGMSPAMIAARSGEFTKLEKLRTMGAEMDGVIHAAILGDIARWASGDPEDLAGRTPVEPLLPKLIDVGLDPNQKNQVNFSVKMDGTGKYETVSSFTSPLHLASRFRSDQVDRLVEAGADVGARDEMGRTPLHIAAAYGNEPACRALINGGADINAKDGDGSTPLHITYDMAIATLLVEQGADVMVKNDFGEYPEGDRANTEIGRFITTKRRHVELTKIAQRSTQEDLATPEQALSARKKYGRAM